MSSGPPPPRESRARFLAAGARRFAVLLVGIAGATALGSLAIGLLAGAATPRALSLGFYLVGSLLLVAGFFVGNRGPARLKDDGDATQELKTGRRVRWASREERVLALNESAIYVTIGFILIVIGLVVDARVRLV
jgi:hypothetical protein